jgi:hypothetical protein
MRRAGVSAGHWAGARHPTGVLRGSRSTAACRTRSAG